MRAEVRAAKEHYITCTAHDIRTPLTSFQLSINILRGTALSTEQAEAVDVGELASNVMAESVDRAIKVNDIWFIFTLAITALQCAMYVNRQNTGQIAAWNVVLDLLCGFIILIELLQSRGL